MFSYFKYKVICDIVLLFTLLFSFRVVVIHVLLFIEGSCTTPLYSFLQELGVIKNDNLHFFLII
jgi:hypothetical protein